MKKHLSILTTFLFAGITFASAQGTRGQKQVDKIMSTFQQVCQLTPDQSAKMLPMVQNFVNIRMQNKKQYAADPNSLRAANADNRKNLHNNLSSVLSPQQMEEYREYIKQQHIQKMQQQQQAQPAGMQPQPSGTQQQ